MRIIQLCLLPPNLWRTMRNEWDQLGLPLRGQWRDGRWVVLYWLLRDSGGLLPPMGSVSDEQRINYCGCLLKPWLVISLWFPNPTIRRPYHPSRWSRTICRALWVFGYRVLALLPTWWVLVWSPIQDHTTELPYSELVRWVYPQDVFPSLSSTERNPPMRIHPFYPENETPIRFLWTKIQIENLKCIYTTGIRIKPSILTTGVAVREGSPIPQITLNEEPLSIVVIG